MRKISLLQIVTMLGICLLSSCKDGDEKNTPYSVDFESALHLTDIPRTLPPISKVTVFQTPVRVDFDTATPKLLLRTNTTPCYSTTNSTEVSNLLLALQESDNQQRITNISRHLGRTFHILLFENDDRKIIHVRVFQPTDVQTAWCNVYPRSSVGFNYFNKQVIAWLSSHCAVPTPSQVKD